MQLLITYQFLGRFPKLKLVTSLIWCHNCTLSSFSRCSGEILFTPIDSHDNKCSVVSSSLLQSTHSLRSDNSDYKRYINYQKFRTLNFRMLNFRTKKRLISDDFGQKFRTNDKNRWIFGRFSDDFRQR